MSFHKKIPFWYRLVSPLCLVLALISLFCAFALLAKGMPEVGVELHRARIEDNQEHQTRLEDRLKKSRWVRRVLIGGLFASSIVFVGAGFMTLNPAPSDE